MNLIIAGLCSLAPGSALAQRSANEHTSEKVTRPQTVGSVRSVQPNWSFGTATCSPQEVQKILASDGEAGDDFGNDVAMSGNLAVIGARWDDEGANRTGSAFVYRYDSKSETWIEEQKLLALDRAADDWLATDVDISNDVVLLGAPLDDDAGSASGSAYIFRFDSNSGSWAQEQKLTASNEAAGDSFGGAVSIRGEFALVGAQLNSDFGEFSGAAYVYRYDPNTSTWAETEKLLPSDGAAGDKFGSEVHLGANVAFIAAAENGDLGFHSGAVYVFEYDPNSSTWSETQKLLASDGAARDIFGTSLALHGDAAIIGASGDDSRTGSAYVFRYDPKSAAWTEEQKLTADDGAADDAYGTRVALHGNIALVGAPHHGHTGGEMGAAYLYWWDSVASNWIRVRELRATNPTLRDAFGVVAVSEDTAIIGAGGDDDNGNHAGAAYVIDLNCPASCDPCDMNCDGTVDAIDIEFFIDILFNNGPRCASCTGDTNGDGMVNAADIEGFINCLFP